MANEKPEWGQLLAVIVVVTIVSVLVWRNGSFGNGALSDRSGSITADELVADIRQSLPVAVDSITTVVGVARIDDGISFTSEMRGVKPIHAGDYRAGVEANMRSTFCFEDVYANMRENGQMIRTNVWTPDGTPLFEVSVTAADCLEYLEKLGGERPKVQAAEALNPQADLSPEERIEALAFNYRSNAPLRLDEMTQITGAEASGKTFTIINQIDAVAVADLSPAELGEVMRVQITKRLCNISEYRFLMDEGIRIHYQYLIEGGGTLPEFTITSESCSQ